MNDYTTELMKALVENSSIEEVFRGQLEKAVNDLIAIELSEYLGYEKYDSSGYGSGNSRNGCYERKFETKYGTLNLVIPRDRNGGFKQQTIPAYRRRDDDLETTVVTLYKHGVTTREIAELVEKMYGHHYSPQTVTNITAKVEEQVAEFHTRRVEARYAVVYCDATWLSVRRDSVAKEAMHVIIGITSEGHKEVLDYAVYPTEAAANYAEMLAGLSERGLEDVLLFVSDGLSGIADALRTTFPMAMHQSCWVHIGRNVERKVRPGDKAEVMGDLKRIYGSESEKGAREELSRFKEKYAGKYPKVVAMFKEEGSLFSFYAFPKEIRASIYNSNLIEANNHGLKRKTRGKEQFPNAESLDRFACTYYSECNRRWAGKAHKGFKKACPELLAMFDRRENGGAF